MKLVLLYEEGERERERGSEARISEDETEEERRIRTVHDRIWVGKIASSSRAGKVGRS